MDVTEPPRVVWEDPGVCAASAHSEDLLRRAVASARAPGVAWVVRIRVDATTARGVRAEGEITGENGTVVARRTLSGASRECDGLAQAVGVWACLVLDTERARSDSGENAKRSDPAAASASETSPEESTAAGASKDILPVAAVEAHPDMRWPAPVVLEKPPPESDWYLHNDEDRTIELGVGAFLLMGTGANVMAGGSPYVVYEAGQGVFLRPSLAIAQSVTPLASAEQARATWAAARFDTCLRLPGLYTRHRGIQLDTCGGADVGLIRFGAAPLGAAGVPITVVTLPFASVGPSLELRGELGGSLAVALRGVAGLNVARPTFQDGTGATVEAPLWSGRIELALSWRLR